MIIQEVASFIQMFERWNKQARLTTFSCLGEETLANVSSYSISLQVHWFLGSNTLKLPFCSPCQSTH